MRSHTKKMSGWEICLFVLLCLWVWGADAQTCESGYSANVTRVVDGDTVDANLDIGFGLTKKVRIRLLDINAPEVRGESRVEGRKATAYLMSLLKVADNQIRVVVEGKDSFGRALGRLYDGSANLNQRMLDSGHAVPYVK